MLKIEKLNQFYGESHTLWDLDLDVPQGQCTCVMGRNGVGKTTLMKCIMGEETTKSGSIEFAGDVELTKKKVEDRSRLGIGYVPQGRQIFPLLTVEENLRGGQQQQLAIGRALVIEPRLLILDEPGEGIQPNIVAQIGEVIRKLIEEDGLTVLLVEQKLPFARKYADRFAILDRGRRVAEDEIAGLTDELIKKHLTV